ncbi:scoloptoxin SSD14 [Scaptodrosophila lebanonensis]|uniref:Scoloptoxin SSD14 n=1 Tax=Drosophila lebanonensis TaxID=7225 RepID=A0A6J2TSJ1_DROLE|nr:scoloptoxin SSD14 [Scaptodrosophila lebanonensis]
MRITVNKKSVVWLVIGALVVLGLTLGLVFGLQTRNTRYITGAVVSNGIGCADVGANALNEGGSAVDAAIATLLCEGVMLPHSMGIGGGFVATIYTRSSRKVETLIARESAPAAATKDMFVGQQEITGAKAGGVPGEILGYSEMHRKYGRLPWEKLFEPTIKLAREGHVVSKYLAAAIQSKLSYIQNEPSLKEVFLKENGDPYLEGETMKRVKLADTLERIAKNGAKEIYGGGETGRMFVEDIQKLDGIITEKDLRNYKVRWESDGHITAHVTGNFTLYTTPLPSSGPLLAFILNVMSELNTEKSEIFWQRTIETFKHAYGQRTNLGDFLNDPEQEPTITETLKKLRSEDFVKQVQSLIFDDRTFADSKYYGANFTNAPDGGTAHMNVLAPNGDAIAITSTINNYFGCKVASSRTGIILNDEMDDFSTPGVINSFGVPASPANYIVPGKRPMSSMSPAIIVDANGNVRLLIGAAGGTKITTSVASVIMKYLIHHQGLNKSVQDGRVHHQLMPDQIDTEAEMDKPIVSYLEQVGHKIELLPEGTGFAAVTAIGALGDPEPVYDRRRVGSTMQIQNRNKMQH